MNIVLFGGAFNPPHIGHLIVIQQALELIDADQLWLLPCYQHTFDKDLAPAEDRLKMLDLLIKHLPKNLQKKVKVCPIEIDYQLSGQTYDAIQKLKSKEEYLKAKKLIPISHNLQSTSYSFLMGSDNLKNFEKWQNWQQLIKNTKFYIYPRNGYQTKKLYKNMQLLQSETQVVTNFSSTIMRQRLKKGLSLKNFIPKKVFKYLAKKPLY